MNPILPQVTAIEFAAAELRAIAAQPSEPMPPTLIALEAAAVAHAEYLAGIAPPVQPQKFRWLDGTNHSGKPGEHLPEPSNSAWVTGTIPNTTKIAYFYQKQLWGDIPFTPGLPPIEAAVRAAFADLLLSPTREFLICDMENFGWALNVPDSEYKTNIGIITKAFQMIRRVANEMGYKTKIGMYGYAPNNYWGHYVHPGASQALTDQAARLPGLNDMLAPIINEVDFLSPSLYLPLERVDFPPTVAEYEKYVKAVAAEGRRIGQGKPQYAHHWDFYLKGDQTVPEGIRIPADVNAGMLRALHLCPDLDGVILWGGQFTALPDMPQIPFDPNEQWHKSLQAEIAR